MTTDARVNAAARHLAARLEADGAGWASFRAALVAARARLGVDQADLAHLLGVHWATVAALERGHRHPALAPTALARLVPELPWADLGVALPRHPDPDRRRHPSARAPAVVLASGRDPPPPTTMG